MGNDQRITLEVPARHNSKEIYDLLEEVLAGLKISDDLIRIVNAGIQLVFPGTGKRREETLTFNVSHPNSCSLRCEPKHDIAKMLLKRWGLDVSEHSENNSAKPAEPKQRIIHV